MNHRFAALCSIRSLHAWWVAIESESVIFIERLPPRATCAAIFFTSALALFTELAMIRWHSACFQAFALFKNISLLSCFLGLGIGFGLAARHPARTGQFLPLLAFQALLSASASHTNLARRHFLESAVFGTPGNASAISFVEGMAFIIVIFVLNALMFVPLGHLVGRLMVRIPALQAYSLNLLGTLVGIAVFFLLSLLWAPPPIWIGIAALGIAPFLSEHARSARRNAACLAIIVIALSLMGDPREVTYFSPYQIIDLRLPDPQERIPTPTIRVNHQFYQHVLDGSALARETSEPLARLMAYYNLPYRLRPAPGNVLVLGSGAGNDVAAALRHGAQTVTAVDIDPAIQYLGRRIHPERPYQDSRTEVVSTDARTFLRQTRRTFDLIVYGLIDSATNLGAWTNVRLDSYVYTVEGFREALGRLADGGLLVVTYFAPEAWQRDRLVAMLTRAYPDNPPRAFTNPGYGGTTVVTGPGLVALPARIEGTTELTESTSPAVRTTEIATDDWPFFYMKSRNYPAMYLLMNLLLLTLSGYLILRQLGTCAPRSRPEGAFLFLGGGFMLIETKAITELGLLFGHTWDVVAMVVALVVLLAFLANQWVSWRGAVRADVIFVLLAVSLALGFGLTQLRSAGAHIPWAPVLMPLALTLPLFFGGLVFSSQIVLYGQLTEPLAANLFGAMLGGLLEYNSLRWGYGSLYLVGAVLYGLAFICLLPARRTGLLRSNAGAAPQSNR